MNNPRWLLVHIVNIHVYIQRLAVRVSVRVFVFHSCNSLVLLRFFFAVMFISSEFLFWFPWPLLLLTLCAGFPLSLSLSAYSLRYVMPSFQFDSVTLFFYSKTCESWARYTPLQSDFIVIQLAFFKTNWIFWNNWQSGASTFGLIFRHLYFGCFFLCFFFVVSALL